MSNKKLYYVCEPNDKIDDKKRYSLEELKQLGVKFYREFYEGTDDTITEDSLVFDKLSDLVHYHDEYEEDNDVELFIGEDCLAIRFDKKHKDYKVVSDNDLFNAYDAKLTELMMEDDNVSFDDSFKEDCDDSNLSKSVESFMDELLPRLKGDFITITLSTRKDYVQVAIAKKGSFSCGRIFGEQPDIEDWSNGVFHEKTGYFYEKYQLIEFLRYAITHDDTVGIIVTEVVQKGNLPELFQSGVTPNNKIRGYRFMFTEDEGFEFEGIPAKEVEYCVTHRQDTGDKLKPIKGHIYVGKTDEDVICWFDVD